MFCCYVYNFGIINNLWPLLQRYTKLCLPSEVIFYRASLSRNMTSQCKQIFIYPYNKDHKCIISQEEMGRNTKYLYGNINSAILKFRSTKPNCMYMAGFLSREIKAFIQYAFRTSNHCHAILYIHIHCIHGESSQPLNLLQFNGNKGTIT